MRSLRRFLGLEYGEDEETALDEALERRRPQHAQFLAAYAAVLARVAYADGCLAPEELDLMRRILAEIDEVSTNDAALIADLAALHVQRSEAEGREATAVLGRVATRHQKLGLLRCLFAVAGAHDGISRIEFKHIAEIGEELGLEGADIAACREAVPRR